MIGYLTAYGVATLVLFALDFLWLGVLAKNFYATQLGSLMLDQPKLGVAALFYLLFTIGVVVFAVKPAVEAGSIWMALGYGALLGFLAYGTYDATNLATLKGWPVIVSVVDVLWGMFVTATTAFAATYVILKTDVKF